MVTGFTVTEQYHLYFWSKWRAVYEVELKIKNVFLLYVDIALYAYYPALCVHKKKKHSKKTNQTSPILALSFP